MSRSPAVFTVLLLPSVLLAPAFLIATPARAVEITNNDAEARAVEIIEGDNVTSVTIEPGESRADICEAGCDMKLGDTELNGLDGGESVSIRANSVAISG